VLSSKIAIVIGIFSLHWYKEIKAIFLGNFLEEKCTLQINFGIQEYFQKKNLLNYISFSMWWKCQRAYEF
jgi:hypothetical protein